MIHYKRIVETAGAEFLRLENGVMVSSVLPKQYNHSQGAANCSSDNRYAHPRVLSMAHLCE
jgi:hypothetical protein